MRFPVDDRILDITRERITIAQGYKSDLISRQVHSVNQDFSPIQVLRLAEAV